MATYKVISDNFTYGKQGSTVTEKELEGLNLQMLLQAGHLEAIATKASEKPQAEKE